MKSNKSQFSRLTRSTLILLPVFGIHYFLFIWNTKPLLISNLILIHLTVHTVSSSLQVKHFQFSLTFISKTNLGSNCGLDLYVN